MVRLQVWERYEHGGSTYLTVNGVNFRDETGGGFTGLPNGIRQGCYEGVINDFQW